MLRIGRRARIGLGLAAAGLGVAIALTAWVAHQARPRDDAVLSPSVVHTEPTVKASTEPVRDPAEELRLWTEKVAAAREAGRDRNPEFAESLLRLADAHRDLAQLGEARATYAEAATVAERHAGTTDWRGREARARLASVADEAVRPDAERMRLARARQLCREAAGLFRTGRYLAAVPVCEEALTLREGIDRCPRIDLAEGRLLLGQLQASRGELYDRAFDTLTQVKDLIREALGPSHPIYGTCLHCLGMLEDDRGAFVEARDLYTAAMAVFAAARGEFSADYARSLDKLGHMEADWWVYGAEARIIRAMQIRESVLGADHPDYAESLHDLGIFKHGNLHYDDAKKLFTRAVAIREKALGPGHPDTAESLSWLGLTQTEDLDLSLGLSYHLQAVAVARQALGSDHPRTCRCLEAFARTCSQEKDYERAEAIFREVEETRVRHGLDRHAVHADMLAARALNRDNWETMHIQIGLDRAEFAPVEREYDRVQALCESLQAGTKLPVYAGCLAMKASMYYYNDFTLKPRAHARDLLVKSLRAMEERGRPTDHPYYINYLHSAWLFNLSEPDYPAAVRYAEEMISYGRNRFGYSAPHWTIQGPMSRAGIELHRGLARGGLPLDALRHVDAVSRYYTFILDRYSWAQSQRARLSSLTYLFEALSGVVTAAVLSGTEAGVYQNLIWYKGHSAAAQAVDRFAFDDPGLADPLSRLRDTRQRLTRLVYHPPAFTAEHADWVREIQRLSDVKDDLESELAFLTRKPGTTPPGAPTVADVQRALPPGTVLVDYFGYTHLGPPPSGRGRTAREPRMVAFVVRPEGPPVCVPLGTRDRVERAVVAWRQAVAAYQTGDESAPVYARSKEVADLIWAPVAGHVGSAKTVLVAPDGPVCYVPFAILPGGKPGTYLIEDRAIGYVASARAVVESYGTAPETTAGGVLTIGGVNYGNGESTEAGSRHPILRPWPELPNTGREAELVVRRFRAAGLGGPDVRLTGADSTPAGFTRATRGRWRYIHYAGHGYFVDPDTLGSLVEEEAGREAVFARTRTGHPALQRNQLLLSGLVLAVDPRDGDRVLTAEQVGSLDLRGTEMVVLSACETGLGNVAGGEGVLGLKRAFLTAGVRTVVASLWKLDDAAAAVLMDEFYTNLWVRKMGKLEALRQAQLTMLGSPDSLRRQGLTLRGIDTAGPRIGLPPAGQSGGRTHPILWGAFVLTGDGR